MRLFYALMPSQEVIATLQEMMTGIAGARWQSPAQLHLTLRFIGDAPAALVDDLATFLVESVPALPPLILSGVGAFESHGFPNAIWVGAMPQEPLTLLHRKLDRACQALGLEPERRRYKPHVTVARLSRNAGPTAPWIERYATFSLAPAPFVRCSLIESISTKEASHYEELAWTSPDTSRQPTGFRGPTGR